jgi:hypothetical protein
MQKDLEFMVSLCYRVSLRLIWATKQDPASERKRERERERKEN